MRANSELFSALAARLPGEKTRNQSGRTITYVTARTIMNRLDEVLGPENWWDRYTPLQNSVICELTIRLPDGSTVTKCDIGGCAGLADAGDDDKSGFSDAFKRAAVKFGVGRYLYGDGTAQLGAPVLETPPSAPAVATPDRSSIRGGAPDPVKPASPEKPKNGTELDAFVRTNRIDRYLHGFVVELARKYGFPATIEAWSPGMVTKAWPEIRQHLVDVKSKSAA
jgi:Rad52/22 family double-strand break repair protein